MNKDTSYLLASSFFISMAVSQLEQIQKSRGLGSGDRLKHIGKVVQIKK